MHPNCMATPQGKDRININLPVTILSTVNLTQIVFAVLMLVLIQHKQSAQYE